MLELLTNPLLLSTRALAEAPFFGRAWAPRRAVLLELDALELDDERSLAHAVRRRRQLRRRGRLVRRLERAPVFLHHLLVRDELVAGLEAVEDLSLGELGARFEVLDAALRELRRELLLQPCVHAALLLLRELEL